MSIDLDYDAMVDFQIEQWEDSRSQELHDQCNCAGPGWCNWCGDDIPSEF